MKFTENITKTTILYILSALFGVLGLLIGSIYSEIFPIALPAIIQQLPKTVLLKMLTVAIILFFLSVALSIVVYLHYKPKLKPKFGILWDRNKETYCPSCSQPLAKYSGKESANLSCNKCNTGLSLITDDGKSITLAEAKKLL